MKFGLRQGLVDKIIEAIASVEEVDQAIIYGSRAKGDYREGSDIDIVIKGKNLSIFYFMVNFIKTKDNLNRFQG